MAPKKGLYGDFDVAYRVQLFGYNDKNSITVHIVLIIGWDPLSLVGLHVLLVRSTG